MNSFSTQKKIAGALGKAVQFNLDGLDPNDAVKRAALESNLNSEMTCRLIEGFNIASSRAYLKSAEDKSGSFPLADKETVIKSAFLDSPLSGGEESANFTAPENFWDRDGSFEMKVASVDDEFSKHAAWCDPAEDNKRDLGDLVEQVKSVKTFYDEEMSNCRQAIASAQDTLGGAVGEIVQYFITSGNHEKFAEFEAEAVSELGTGAIEVLDLVTSLTDGSVKRAENPERFSDSVFPTLDFSDQLGLVESALAARIVTDESTRKLAETTRLRDSEASALDEFVKRATFGPDYSPAGSTGAASLLSPPTTNIKNADVVESAKGIIATAVPSQVPGMSAITDLAKGDLTKEYGKAAVEGFRKDRERGLTDSDQSELDNLRRQTILQDLIMNDEILSTQDPSAVSHAYASLLSINPRATLIPEVARSVLRNSVSSTALDTFTAEQMAKLENKMMANESGDVKGGDN